MGRLIKNEYVPQSVTHPGETLIDVLEERGMSQVELAERLGRPKITVNRIVKGKTAITPDTAIQLERVFKISASFWNSRQRIYDEFTARKSANESLRRQVAWIDGFPLGAMIKNGWIHSSSDKVAQLNELLRFFGVNSPKQWHTIWASPQATFRQSKAFKLFPKANSIWLRKGELEANEIMCESFDKDKFHEALQDIRKLTRQSPEDFVEKVVRDCAKCGVAVVFVPLLQGVPVYGVTRWLHPEKALIQLSLRGKYEDMFWFTFFHESGHLLLHGKRDVFVESETDRDEREDEANRFARDSLIPPRKWRGFVNQGPRWSRQMVIQFANEIGISPAIVLVRLQHEELVLYSHMNALRSRYQFTE